MGFFDFLKPKKNLKMSSWQEYGTYKSQFIQFGNNAYSASIVRACVRPLADLTSKASIKCEDKQLQRLITYRPNIYMNGVDFLRKIRTLYEIKGNVFIYIMRDATNRVNGLYPIPYQSFRTLEYNGRIYLEFEFVNKTKNNLVVAWDDLAILRKDYYVSDVAGEDGNVLLPDLELQNTVKQGLVNAIKSTANLRGILKNTKAMLADDDIKERQRKFVADYMNMSNEGGIASLDATQEFQPISMSPIVTTYTQMKEIRENIYKYYGVNDKIIMGNLSPEELETFCEAKISPFLIALATELTSKIYSGKAIAYEQNAIYMVIDKLQFASTQTKLSMTSLVDRGAMTPNEWRALFGLEALEGGDSPIRRLDTASIADEKAKEEEENADEE